MATQKTVGRSSTKPTSTSRLFFMITILDRGNEWRLNGGFDNLTGVRLLKAIDSHAPACPVWANRAGLAGYRRSSGLPRTTDIERPARQGSPVEEGASERRAPEGLAAWERVAELASRTAPPPLDAALRLAAQQHHEFRSLAGFRAHRLVRDDQGRPRRHVADAIQSVLRNGAPIWVTRQAGGGRSQWESGTTKMHSSTVR